MLIMQFTFEDLERLLNATIRQALEEQRRLFVESQGVANNQTKRKRTKTKRT